MSILKEARPEAAFLKMGIYGKAGSGKTYTASSVAIALHQLTKSKKPIAFLDTESGSDYIQPIFKEAKIKLMVAKTRKFTDLLEVMVEAEKTCFALITDSVTHYWDDLKESYRKKHKLTTISHPKHWQIIKPEWWKFSSFYLTSALHFIVCGRAGDVWEMVTDEEGVKELQRTGTQMRTEKELSYEPSLLVEMVKTRLNDNPGAGYVHRAFIIKDRFSVSGLEGKHFDDPTLESFLPHVELLNIGGEHRALESDGDSQDLFDDDNDDYGRQKAIVLEKIKEEFYIAYPSQGTEDKQGRSELRKNYFNTRSWTEIEGLHLDKLNLGFKALEIHNSEDMKRQRKELEENKNKKETRQK